jgi:ribosomal protein L7/L12
MELIVRGDTWAEIVAQCKEVVNGSSSGPAAIELTVMREMKQNGIISAIKLHRTLTGLGLKDSKDYCDQLRVTWGLQG